MIANVLPNMEIVVEMLPIFVIFVSGTHGPHWLFKGIIEICPSLIEWFSLWVEYDKKKLNHDFQRYFFNTSVQ